MAQAARRHLLAGPGVAKTWLGAALLALSAGAQAVEASVAVTVRVNVVSSTGACGAVAEGGGIGVQCVAPPRAAQAVLPTVLTSPAPGAGTTPALYGSALLSGRVAGAQSSDLSSGAVQITSWRSVSSDNGSYVELTIAW